jgi:hypothetical protein
MSRCGAIQNEHSPRPALILCHSASPNSRVRLEVDGAPFETVAPARIRRNRSCSSSLMSGAQVIVAVR